MMNRNLLLTVAALFAIGASGANAAQVDFRLTEKLEKSNKVESFQTGGHGHVGETVDKTDLSISSATGGAGAGKSRKSKGEQDCQRFACANGKH
jgi:hypothetical protein